MARAQGRKVPGSTGKAESRETMEPLEARLRAVYDPILKEPIPERLLEVLRQARSKAAESGQT